MGERSRGGHYLFSAFGLGLDVSFVLDLFEQLSRIPVKASFVLPGLERGHSLEYGGFSFPFTTESHIDEPIGVRPVSNCLLHFAHDVEDSLAAFKPRVLHNLDEGVRQSGHEVPCGLGLVLTRMFGRVIAYGFSQQIAFTPGFERTEVGIRDLW